MASRSLVGSLATLTTSVVNLTVLMVLKGEPGWICLMCCNADILFCVIVLHWVTSKDRPSSYTSTHASRGGTVDETARERGDSVATERGKEGYGNAMSKRGSIAKGLTACDVVESSLETRSQPAQLSPHAPSPNESTAPMSPAQACLSGSVKTQIRSAHASARSKSKSRILQMSRTPSESGDDELELYTIHVQKEVCIDHDGAQSESVSRSVEGSVRWAMGNGGSVSAEEMV